MKEFGGRLGVELEREGSICIVRGGWSWREAESGVRKWRVLVYVSSGVGEWSERRRSMCISGVGGGGGEKQTANRLARRKEERE